MSCHLLLDHWRCIRRLFHNFWKTAEMTAMMSMVEMMRSGVQVMMQQSILSMEGDRVGMEMGMGLVEVEVKLQEGREAQLMVGMGAQPMEELVGLNIAIRQTEVCPLSGSSKCTLQLQQRRR